MPGTTLANNLISSVKRGKQILQNVFKTQKAAAKVAKQQQPALQVYPRRCQPFLSLFRLQHLWRGFMTRNYYNSIAAQLGRRAAWRAGRDAPLLAFVGLVIAQNVETRDEEEMSSRIQDFLKIATPDEHPIWGGIPFLSLKTFDFGQRIGQGCNAAVYEARVKEFVTNSKDVDSFDDDASDITVLSDTESVTEPVSTFTNKPDLNYDPSEEEPADTEVQPTVTGYCTDDTANDESHETGSDITIISSELDEEMMMNEWAPQLFTVRPDSESLSDSEFSVITMESLSSSEVEFDVETLHTSEVGCEMMNGGAPQLFTVSPDEESGSESEFSVISMESLSSSEEESNLEDAVLHTSKLEFDMMNESMKLSKVLPSMGLSSSTVLQWLVQQDDCAVPEITETNDDTYHSLNSSILLDDGRTRPKLKFDLAIKIMFNYDIESNSEAILKSMEKETVPALFHADEGQREIFRSRNKRPSLPAHPNIVEMWGVFVDEVPGLPDSYTNYPAALPKRINPDGMGRNQTMFVVMKRYDMTLTEYLSLFNPSFRERIFLLAQLLEAVSHLTKHGIAHRDMKADNILVDTTRDGPALLVLSDFGCCLADSNNGLQLPYPTDEIDKGGNSALMAPEIASARPGPYTKLDYRKADLWGVGAIAYEILGADNPFYSSAKDRLDSQTYDEADLPPLPGDVPKSVEVAVMSLLTRDPCKRPTARQVLSVLYTYLWCPEIWLNDKVKVKVTKQEATWAIISTATELILRRLYMENNSVEVLLMNYFVKNLRFQQLNDVLRDFNTCITK